MALPIWSSGCPPRALNAECCRESCSRAGCARTAVREFPDKLLGGVLRGGRPVPRKHGRGRRLAAGLARLVQRLAACQEHNRIAEGILRFPGWPAEAIAPEEAFGALFPCRSRIFSCVVDQEINAH